MYSGYADVTATKKLHYVLITSQNSMQNDPLQIWFNGGPGCSSMMGIFQEHGPFVVDDGTNYLVSNMWSWNKKANMLYIEMPGGVGFSTCDHDAGECVFTDKTTTDDNIVALVNWFKKYDDFKKNKLFISGESYAGVYVPWAAKGMLDYNTQVKDPTKEFTFNLKGYIVGNAVTNWDLDCDKAYVTMGFWHGLYGKELKDKMEAGKCDYGNMEFMPAINAECMGYYNEFLTLTQKVNTYDVFRKCYTNTDDPVSFLYAEDNFGMAKVGNQIKTYRKYYTTADYTPFLYHHEVQEARKMVADIPPCVYGSYVVDYLNKYEVRTALHIPDDVQAWGYCTDNPLWNYASGKNASYSIYEEMLTKHPEI
jgi:cathepsin A (carboxypeptidase C)